MKHLTTTLPLLATSLFTIVAPLGCDDSTTSEFTEVDGADLVASAAADGAGRLEVKVDDELRPDLVLSVVQADPDTTIYFTRSDVEVDGHYPVDVTIVGRDGGFDYGRLLAEEGATPLELYLAITDHQKPVPEALQIAHDREVEVTRLPSEGPRPLAVPGPDPLSVDDDLIGGLSSFTCLSWTNFQEYIGDVFAGAPGRSQVLEVVYTADTLYAPAGAPSFWFNDTHKVEMVGCNKNSSDDPEYSDSLYVRHCVMSGLGGPINSDCRGMWLNDGYYVRRIYGPVTGYRFYKSESEGYSAPSLSTYLGIVKRDI